MNKDEHKRSAKAARLHQRERMRHWSRSCAESGNSEIVQAAIDAGALK